MTDLRRLFDQAKKGDKKTVVLMVSDKNGEIVVREQASKRLSGSLFFGCGGI